ncbi:Do family serine endopeptidase [Acidiphilium sp. AL]|uniref:Do family serine endopeptidase n=1 Tax=Acidiphilium iwatense TaxID=768198 RepID=A0ABS9E2M7_9PROT|nr:MULTISPECIES: Do family serine endopeptidase [Acidiphilium]MCF3947849.1 Do family serine endopeptidase [Acidiphilium iwatense]MCU4160056.1 Do family serine endopeptidase [Acidiphilium sp. AL]
MTVFVARRRPQRIAALSAVLLAGTALAAVSLRPALAGDQSLNATAKVQQDFKPIPSFAPLVKDVKPAVVSVTVHLKVQNAVNAQGQMQGPQGMPFPFPFPFPNPQQQQAVEAKGSGFFISPKGYLVTNNHVVKHAKSVFVTLSDGERLPAKVVGTDPNTDLAVLKVTRAKPFPYLELGDSAKVVPGQWVIAIGNPFGLAETVTTGVVSALGRDIGDGEYDSFIQVDAPINEGNSGGPLLNQKGEVIGVNTAILTPTGGSVGIGFSIPSDMVKRITADLIKSGHVTRGFIGVQVQLISPEMAQAMGIKTKDGKAKGALIAATEPNSPAAKAGIKPGDVITKVDGKAVTDPRDLALAISDIKPGNTAHVSYLRDGKPHDVTITVEKMPANAQAAFNQGGNNSTSSTVAKKPELGLTLAPLTETDRQQLNMPMSSTGALVAHVTPNSPADEAGLRSGDVIVGVGSSAIANPNQAVDAIHKAETQKAKAIALRVMRGNQAIFVAVPLPKPGAKK